MDFKTQYGTNGQAITITIEGVANNGARQSAAIDNSTNRFRDALVQLSIKNGASGAGAAGYCEVLAYGSADGGAHYSDGATGADAAITLTNPPNMRRIGLLNMVTNGATYVSDPMSVAAAFGGELPEFWGIVVVNKTGTTLDDATAWYQGKYEQGDE